MIKIHVAKEVTVTGANKDLVATIKKVLTLPNPAYHKIMKVTGSAWAVPRDFKFYKANKHDGFIVIPRGILNRFKAYCDKQHIQYEETRDLIDRENPHFFTKKPELREYQSPLVEDSLKAKEGGVIVAGTGSGKTIIALEIARRLRKTTLIICPNTVIQDQFIDKAKEFFDYEIGVINGKKKEIKPITVTTWQSLQNKELREKCAEEFSIIMIDECHGVVSDVRAGTLAAFKPQRLYGFTGSPRRSKEDGRTAAIFFLIGDKICDYEVTQLTPSVETIYTGVDIPAIEYHEMIDEMVKHEGRNTLIAGLVNGEVMSGRKVLVLTKRIEHYKLIHEKATFEGMSYVIDSQDPNRAELLNELSNGDRPFFVIFGTVALLATGLDIPSLDTLIIACDMKSDVMVQQGAGRVLRLFKDKTSPKIIDLVDNLNPILKRQAWERISFYQRMGWKVN